MYFKFERSGLSIPEREIEEVVTLTIDLINELYGSNKEVYKDEDVIENAVETIITNSMEETEIYYYYNLIQPHFLKGVQKRIIKKLMEGGE